MQDRFRWKTSIYPARGKRVKSHHRWRKRSKADVLFSHGLHSAMEVTPKSTMTWKLRDWTQSMAPNVGQADLAISTACSAARIPGRKTEQSVCNNVCHYSYWKQRCVSNTITGCNVEESAKTRAKHCYSKWWHSLTRSYTRIWRVKITSESKKSSFKQGSQKIRAGWENSAYFDTQIASKGENKHKTKTNAGKLSRKIAILVQEHMCLKTSHG